MLFGQAVAVQTDGKIVLAGYFISQPGNVDFALVRYNANGTLDASFGSGGIVVTAFGGFSRCLAVAIKPTTR